MHQPFPWSRKCTEGPSERWRGSTGLPGKRHVEKLRAEWRKLRAGTPGRRFQDQHRRRKAQRSSSTARVVWIAIGVALLLAGVFLMLVPGPGIPLFVLGAALIGQESLFVARRMDATELWLRKA